MDRHKARRLRVQSEWYYNSATFCPTIQSEELSYKLVRVHRIALRDGFGTTLSKEGTQGGNTNPRCQVDRDRPGTELETCV